MITTRPTPTTERLADLLALRRTLARHRMVVVDLERHTNRASLSTVRDYLAEAEALERAIAVLDGVHRILLRAP